MSREKTQDAQDGPVAGRRRFMRWLGVGGLTTSAAIFGDRAAASATCNVACCHLYICPDVTYNFCRSGANYTWSCMYTGTVGCGCCETGGLQPNWTGHSAYQCDHV